MAKKKIRKPQQTSDFALDTAYGYVVLGDYIELTPREARKLAPKLLQAAAWLEQEKKRK